MVEGEPELAVVHDSSELREEDLETLPLDEVVQHWSASGTFPFVLLVAFDGRGGVDGEGDGRLEGRLAEAQHFGLGHVLRDGFVDAGVEVGLLGLVFVEVFRCGGLCGVGVGLFVCGVGGWLLGVLFVAVV